MNGQHIADLVDLIGDEPGAIQGLRRLAVGLAIGGQLGLEDAATDLRVLASALTKISGAKARLAHVTEDDLPSALGSPDRFASLGAVARIEKGRTGIQSAIPGEYPLVVTAEQRLTSDHYDFDGKAVIVPLVSSAGHGKASIHRLHYEDGKFALGTILAAIFPHRPDLLSPRFLFEYLSAFKDDLLVRRMIGTANVTLTVGKLCEVPVPLIPASAQERVDGLMALCDQLEAARAEREAARDRLAAASLARLNAPDPETFADDSRFALDVLPALTARPDQIKQLRQTILNLAVRGKLVPQDAGDEPASELLKRAAKEIAAYSKINRIGQSHSGSITDDDQPFSAPPGWQWTRLCALFKVITDGDHQPPPKADKGVAFLTIGNITTGRLDFTGCRTVPEAYFRSLPPYRTPAHGDILYTVVGATYGRAALVETDRDFCVQRHIAILKPVESTNLRFLLWLLASPPIYEQASRSTTGTAQPTVGLRPLRNFVAPVPPLAEQHRIVAKVQELMALCDQLEASLTTADATRRRLLDALLAEALAPAEQDLEAA